MGNGGSKQSIDTTMLNTNLVSTMMENRMSCFSDLDLTNYFAVHANCSGEFTLTGLTQENQLSFEDADCSNTTTLTNDVETKIKAAIENDAKNKSDALQLPWSGGTDTAVKNYVQNFTKSTTEVTNFFQCMSNVNLKNAIELDIAAKGNCTLKDFKQSNVFKAALKCFNDGATDNSTRASLEAKVITSSKNDAKGALGFIADTIDSVFAPLGQFADVAKWGIVAAVIAGIIGAIVLVISKYRETKPTSTAPNQVVFDGRNNMQYGQPPQFKFKNFIAAKMTWEVFSKNQLNSIQQSKRKKYTSMSPSVFYSLG